MTFIEQLFEKLGETFSEISSNSWKALSTSVAHVSIKISIDLAPLKKNCCDLNLDESIWKFTQILDLIYSTVSIFILIWRDTEHQQFKAGFSRDHFSSQARRTDGKGTMRSLDHSWKQTKFFSKNNTSKDIVIKN